MKIVKSKEELLINAFDNWFKKIDVQWEQSASYTSQQNSKIKKAMYTIILAVRSIMKNFRLSLDLWDLIVEAMMYTKNRTIIFNESDENAITFYEAVNEIRSDVSNFRTLRCRAYTHISKTIFRHKFDDRFWKSIHVSYEDNNQWKIYNSRTRKIHLTRNVRFDENYFYYEKNHASSEFFAKTNNEFEVIDFWIEENDDELNSKSHRRRITSEVNDAIDSEFEKNENEKYVEIFENSLTQSNVDSNFSNLNDSIFDAEFERSQTFFISDNSISKNAMTSSRQTQSSRDSVFDDQSSQSEKIWENDENLSVDSAEQSSITIIVRRRNRKSASSIDREIRIFKSKTFRFDYKKLQISRQFQSKRRANVINNTYNAKQVSKSHIHMMRALHALNNDESFDFDHISKSLNYREVRKSSH